MKYLLEVLVRSSSLVPKNAKSGTSHGGPGKVQRRFRISATFCKAVACIVFICSAFTCTAQTAKPVITRIDPPNWFTELPDSLLLVHGEHLERTSFRLRNTAARVTETSTSTNGHWAFLTLSAARAKAGSFEIVASNVHGSTSAPYMLVSRRVRAQQPKGFNGSDVIYLIMPDRFADGDTANDTLKNFRDPDDRHAGRAYHGGDLRGIQNHLDYLKATGVTTIWTTPLYDNSAGQSGQSYHGYSATNMYAVDPHFGSMADYRALVDAAHARGMKVILDTVPNHVGAANVWASDPPTPDWLHGTPAAHIKVDDDFASVTDTAASVARRKVLLNGWFADVLPDLNQDSPLVAQYLAQNAIWWIESVGLDGLRIDTFPYVPRSFWDFYNGMLHVLYPHLTAVGEVFNADPHVTSFFAGGRANTGSDGTFDTLLDTPFDYPLYFALRKSLTHDAPISAIADVLAQDALYPHPERLVTFIGNHDVKRFISESGASQAALHLGFGLLATLRGTPELYYGDEIAMPGGDDPDNRKDFPGGFATDQHDAFLNSGRTPEQQSLYIWVKTIFQLRAHTPALQSGQQSTVFSDANTLAFVRSLDPATLLASRSKVAGNCTSQPHAERYLIVVNNAAKPEDIAIPASSALAGCTRFTSALPDNGTFIVLKPGLQVHLPAQEIGIFRAQP